jgi:formiminotetrahydrofolate cyclodeaminase
VTSLLELRVAELLDAVAAREPAPGGGAVAALAASLAGALLSMASRFAGTSAERAEELRAAAAVLADADAAAYDGYLRAARSARGSGDRTAALAALDAATDVPLAVLDVATEVAQLAATVVVDGNQRLRGDATAAVLMASGAAEIAAVLVRENVGAGDSRALLAAARAAEVRTLAESVSGQALA